MIKLGAIRNINCEKQLIKEEIQKLIAQNLADAIEEYLIKIG